MGLARCHDMPGVGIADDLIHANQRQPLTTAGNFQGDTTMATIRVYSYKPRQVRTPVVGIPRCLQKYAHMIARTSDERSSGDGFWVHLKDGWLWDGGSTIHEATPTACARVMKEVTIHDE